MSTERLGGVYDFVVQRLYCYSMRRTPREDPAVAEQRVVKIPMRLDLIRRMDGALAEGRGGFTTRADLMTEAVEQFLVEISYEEAPPEPPAGEASSARLAHRPPAVDRSEAEADRSSLPHPRDELQWNADPPEPLELRSLAETALRFAGRGAIAEDGVARPEDEPLLGLHNRDYPSLWAAHQLAAYTRDGLLPWREFVSRATADGWEFAARLQELERAGHGRRLTALFPANREKQQSAERGFQSFAIGTAPHRGDGSPIPVSGPLFMWRMAQLQHSKEGPRVGLTTEGWDLLEALDGLSLEMPHGPELAAAFFAHLRRHAPADWWGFEHVLRVVAERPDRSALVRAFATARSEWTPSMASSLAQGHVARGREWGLIEPRQVDGRYWLTEFGHRQLEELHS